MNKNRSIIYIFSAALAFTSCMDEIKEVENDKIQITSEHIVFGGARTNDIVVTRSGEAPSSSLTEMSLESESGSVSLPLFVRVEQGINTYGPATRAAITTEIDEITQLDAWATKNTYTDASKTQIQSRTMFFTGNDGNATTGALFTKEAGNEDLNGDGEIDDLFYPDGNGPYLWEKAASSVSEFQFVTVSPANSGFKANINPQTLAVTFDYTVPAAAAEQKDILVAVPAPVPINYGQPVPLDYKHVMAAVNVKVGDKIPSGTIKSIKFVGVYNKGSYFPNSNEWTNRTVENGGEFNVVLPEGGLNVGQESLGTSITTTETSFMMIPQQLFTGAEMVVEFHDDNTNKDVVLRASIQGDVWAQNTTTNYVINIDANYNVSIVPLDKILDSHYIITKVEVSSEYPYWTLTAAADDDSAVTVQLESNVNPMAKLGFWTDKVAAKEGDTYYVPAAAESARGTNVEAGLQGESQIVYVFIPENVSGNTRHITLTLTGYGTSGETAEKTLVLEQNSVMWLHDPLGTGEADAYWGCELILEGGQVPWGFCFDDLNEDWRAYGKVDNQPPGWIDKIVDAMEAAGLNVTDLYAEDSPIRIISREDHKSTFLIRIDYGKLGEIDIAKELMDGHQNTEELYGFEGINVIASIKDFLIQSAQAGNKEVEHVPGTFNGELDQTLDFAAMYAMKRNRFHLYTEVIAGDGGAATMSIPYIEPKDIKWYLPARGQFEYFMYENWGQQFSFNDSFWTSTAYLPEDVVDNTQAYSYTNGIEGTSHRNTPYLTFALRLYTLSENIEIGGDNIIVPGGGDNGPEQGEGGGNGGNTGGDIEGNT